MVLDPGASYPAPADVGGGTVRVGRMPSGQILVFHEELDITLGAAPASMEGCEFDVDWHAINDARIKHARDIAAIQHMLRTIWRVL